LSFTGAAGAAPIEATSASAVAATASNAVKRNMRVSSFDYWANEL
jgi:hypothetical protein